ncbi:MAG: hypothetical protein ACR2JV_07455 [Gaiellales bacterium]
MIAFRARGSDVGDIGGIVSPCPDAPQHRMHRHDLGIRDGLARAAGRGMLEPRRSPGATLLEEQHPMSAENDTVANPMTQLDYAERTLEDRDTGTASASALLSGLACGLGVLSLWFAPMIIGFVAIACAILGLSLAGTRDRIGKIGLIIAVMGWLIGSIIGIFVGHSVISLNIS